MVVHRKTLAIAALIGMGALPRVGHAQADIATGTLRGKVSDISGEPIAGARITVTNTASGLTRSRVSDTDGRFLMALLPPGSYTLLAAADGFAAYEQRGLRIRVGEVPFLTIRLELPAVSDRLVVTREVPVVERTRTSATTTIDSGAVDSLPSNGRDFKDLMFLAPQVGEVFGRPTVAGGEGMMNSFNVDGADSNSQFLGEQLGGTIAPFTYSRAAIREFQILRSSYNPRFGGAAGGIVNAVTKSGTNTPHGSAFLFFQDEGMVEKDALGNRQETFRRRQGGLTFGGPLRRDRVHGFLAYDAQRREQTTFRRPLGLDPSLESAFDAKLAGLGIDPDSEFDYVVTNDTDVTLVRVDWAVNDGNRLWLRNNFSDQRGENVTFAFATSGRSNLGREESRFNSTVGSLTSVLGRSAFNEVIAQLSSAERVRSANVTDVPSTVIGGFAAVIGQAFHLPSSLDERRVQLQEHLTLSTGNHSLRVGVDYSYLDLENSFLLSRGGRYFLPTYQEFLEEQPCSTVKPWQPPCLYIQAFSPIDGRVGFETHLLSLYAGDEWRPTSSLTLEYGLRLEHQENPAAQNPNPLEPLTAFIPDDTNVAPRVGFAWDIGGDGRSVLRGGTGVFHGWMPSLVAGGAMLENGVNGSTIFLFQGLGPFFPHYPNRLPPEAGEVVAGIPPDIRLISPEFENPETYRFSLGYDRAVRENFRVGAELMWAKSRHRVRQWNVNQDPTPVDTFADGRPIYGNDRLDPSFGHKLQFTSDAEAEYFSMVVSAEKRYGSDWFFQAHYTYSESKDHDSFETDELIGAPEDQYNLDQDWGWSTGDARHRIVGAVVYAAGGGFTISALGSYRDALPINPFAGTDLNNDGLAFDRPGPDPELGLDQHLDRNSFRGSSVALLDLRLSKTFAVAGTHEVETMVEIFNVTNAAVYTAFDAGFLRFGQLNPDFGKPVQAAQPRALQLGLRYRF